MKAFSVFFLVALALASSCKKTVEKDLEREQDRITGTWTVTRIRYVQTDTLGKTLRDSAVTDAGTMEFQRASEEGAEVFHPVLFRGACVESELVRYFRSFTAGDPVVGGGWSLYWDADPAAERMILWGIGPSTSWHRVMNWDGDGEKRRTMWYLIPQPPNSGKREFCYFDMEK